MDSENKICRWCCQVIPIDARRCPHCTTMQAFWGHGALAVIPTLVAVLIFVAFFSTVFRKSSKDADQIDVGETRMVFGRHDGNSTASVIGMLKNNMDMPLDDLQLEAQFFDDGELLDVGTHTGYSETIPANGETAFKVYVYANRPEEEYATFKVFVRSAEDATAFP